jgi:D-cysteine desulfhydrase
VSGEPFLHRRWPGLDLGHLALGTGPTPVRRLPGLLEGVDLWLKDESGFGDGAWGGNKVRKLEWILPEATRRRTRTLFTVGGIGTHWGLACALYGREHGFRTVLGLVDQPVDDHVRQQLARLEESGARLHRYASVARLKLAAPWLVASNIHGGRLPWYLPAGGSNPVGTLGYVETALEIAAQVRAGDLPEPATVVTAIGSGGTAAGLALGFRLAGLRTRVFGAVVNDAFPLDAPVIARLANSTGDLLRARGAGEVPRLEAADLTTADEWLGTTYGDPTPASNDMVGRAREVGLDLEPVYTGKALAAIRDLGDGLPGPVLWLNTHGPR